MFKALKYILGHPVNRQHKIAAVRDYLKWQIVSRLSRQKSVVNWIEDTKLVVAHGDQGLTGNIYTGLHEFKDMTFLLHFLRSDDVFVDIGANGGSYTVLASGVCHANSVSFEPLLETFNKLEANISINQLESRVQAHNSGLSHQAAVLWFSTELGTYNHVVDADSPELKTKVSVLRLDDALQRTPELIKIDVEGYELRVLRGANRILSDQKLKSVIVEINDSGIQYGNQPDELVEHLLNKGFQMYDYVPFERRLVPIGDRDALRGNGIFVRDLPFVLDRLNSSRKFQVRSIRI